MKVPLTRFEIGVVVVVAVVAATLFLVHGTTHPDRRSNIDIACMQISAMMSALEEYVQECGRYPGTAADGYPDGANAFPALFEALFLPRGAKPPLIQCKEQDVAVWDAGRECWRKAEPAEIRDAKVRKYLPDPWGEPYVYHENKSRPRAKYMRNPAKVDLYSTGPDRCDETIEGRDGDDVGSW